MDFPLDFGAVSDALDELIPAGTAIPSVGEGSRRSSESRQKSVSAPRSSQPRQASQPRPKPIAERTTTNVAAAPKKPSREEKVSRKSPSTSRSPSAGAPTRSVERSSSQQPSRSTSSSAAHSHAMYVERLSQLQRHNYGMVLAGSICTSTGSGAPGATQIDKFIHAEKSSHPNGTAWTTNTARDPDGASMVVSVNYRTLKLSTDEDPVAREKVEVYSDLRIVLGIDSATVNVNQCDIFCSHHPSSGFVPVVRGRSVFDDTAKQVMKGEFLLDEITVKGNLIAPFVKIVLRSSSMLRLKRDASPETIRLALVSVIKSPTISKKVTKMFDEPDDDDELDRISLGGDFEDAAPQPMAPPKPTATGRKPAANGKEASSAASKSKANDAPAPAPAPAQRPVDESTDTLPPATCSSTEISTAITESPHRGQRASSAAAIQDTSPKSTGSTGSNLAEVVLSGNSADAAAMKDLVERADASETDRLRMLLRRQHEARQRFLDDSEEVPVEPHGRRDGKKVKKDQKTKELATVRQEAITPHDDADEEFERNEQLSKRMAEQQQPQRTAAMPPKGRKPLAPEADSEPTSLAAPIVSARDIILANARRMVAAESEARGESQQSTQSYEPQPKPPLEAHKAKEAQSKLMAPAASSASPPLAVSFASQTARHHIDGAERITRSRNALAALPVLEASDFLAHAFHSCSQDFDNKIVFQPNLDTTELATTLVVPQPIIVTTSKRMRVPAMGSAHSGGGVSTPALLEQILCAVVMSLVRYDVTVVSRFHEGLALHIAPSGTKPAANVEPKIVIIYGVDAGDAIRSMRPFLMQNDSWLRVSSWIDTHQRQFEWILGDLVSLCGGASQERLHQHFEEPFEGGRGSLMYYSDLVAGHPLLPLLPAVMFANSGRIPSSGKSIELSPICWSGFCFTGSLNITPSSAGNQSTNTSVAESTTGGDHPDGWRGVLRLVVREHRPQYYVWQRPGAGPSQRGNLSFRVVLAHQHILSHLRPSAAHSVFDGLVVSENDVLVLSAVLSSEEFAALRVKLAVVPTTAAPSQPTNSYGASGSVYSAPQRRGSHVDMMEVLRIALERRWATVGTTLLAESSPEDVDGALVGGSGEQGDGSAADDRMMDTAYCWGYQLPCTVVCFFNDPKRFAAGTLRALSAVSTLDTAISR